MATLKSVKSWYDEVDVLIIGCGLSGAVTAITVHDLDHKANILIIEKNPKGFFLSSFSLLLMGRSKISSNSGWVHAPPVFQQNWCSFLIITKAILDASVSLSEKR